MNILITGTTGYIGKRLIPLLLGKGHYLYCTTRDYNRIPKELAEHSHVHIIEIDFLNPVNNNLIPQNIDVAYYLMHSMSTSSGDFSDLEIKCAENFKLLLEKTNVKQVIYLSGIVNDSTLSKHLKSRQEVEKTLQSNQYALTTLKAGVIVGSGSASFEIIRDLVEKLPLMITPKWLNTKTQPIAIRDVLKYLHEVINRKEFFNGSFDIFGPDTLTYKEMLLQFSEVRELKRYIYTLPIFSPKLSSYWLFFVTSTSYNLAKSLVSSMKVEIIGKPGKIQELIRFEPISYKKAVQLAFLKIAQNEIVSSWTDSMVSGVISENYSNQIHIPTFGCFKDNKIKKVNNELKCLDNIWQLGGEKGWYKFQYLWELRGFIDKLFGGVGLRRGRRHPTELKSGDSLDFWRVLVADKSTKRLLLYAEMKLPGEAWLEFKIIDGVLYQNATFRPKGVLGRLYWYSVLPFHGFVFSGLIKHLSK